MDEQYLDWCVALGGGPFEDVREGLVAHEAVFDAEAMLAQVASLSWVAVRPEAERSRLFAELRMLLPEGTSTMSLDTEVYWTRLRWQKEYPGERVIVG